MKSGDSAVGWSAYLDSFALALKVEGLKPHTVSCYVRDVRKLGDSTDWLPPSQIKAQHVRAHVDVLREQVDLPHGPIPSIISSFEPVQVRS
jgi:hypothetical protein